MDKKLLSCIMILAAACSPVTALDQTAEEKSTRHHYDITVTANLIETSLRYTASSVTVITREELERTQKTTLLEALEDVPGISTAQNGATGAAASVYIRGANPEHTKILLDGVEVNDPITPNRSLDLSLFLIENVERIEILRGPQSTLYGSDAMAGVINIITRKGEDQSRVSLTTGTGSYGEIRGGAILRKNHEKFNLSLSAAFLQTEGLSAASSEYEGNKEKDGTRNISLRARFVLKPTEKSSFHLSANMILAKTEIDNFGGPYGDDPNNIQDYNVYTLEGGFRARLLENRWEQRLDVSLVSYQRSYDNPPDSIHPFESDWSDYHSSFMKVEWRNNLYLHENNTLVLGASWQQEAGESEYHYKSFYESISLFPREKANLTSVYVQDILQFKGGFFVSAGARWDRHSLFGNAVTFRIAPALLFPETGTKLKVTYGTAFKAPSLYQLYAPPVWGPLGNEDLQPEKSRGWDAGVEQAFLQDRLILGATYFQNDFDDLIQWDWLQGYINIASASTRGVEFITRAYPHRKLSLQASYTRTKAIDEETDTALLRRPMDKFSARLNLNFLQRGQISLAFIYFGEREDLFFVGWTSERVTMPAFSLLNAVLSYALRDGLQVYLRLHNILDTEYEWVKGYGTRGFSVQGGVRLQR